MATKPPAQSPTPATIDVGSKKLLFEAAQALQDWITTYASDQCKPAAVKEARERISMRGGTIFYAAELSQRLREASDSVGHNRRTVASLSSVRAEISVEPLRRNGILICKCGSCAINHNDHGRDGSGVDVCDVCYWRTKAESLQAKIDGLTAE